MLARALGSLIIAFLAFLFSNRKEKDMNDTYEKVVTSDDERLLESLMFIRSFREKEDDFLLSLKDTIIRQIEDGNDPQKVIDFLARQYSRFDSIYIVNAIESIYYNKGDSNE